MVSGEWRKLHQMSLMASSAGRAAHRRRDQCQRRRQRAEALEAYPADHHCASAAGADPADAGRGAVQAPARYQRTSSGTAARAAM